MKVKVEIETPNEFSCSGCVYNNKKDDKCDARGTDKCPARKKKYRIIEGDLTPESIDELRDRVLGCEPSAYKVKGHSKDYPTEHAVTSNWKDNITKLFEEMKL